MSDENPYFMLLNAGYSGIAASLAASLQDHAGGRKGRSSAAALEKDLFVAESLTRELASIAMAEAFAARDSRVRLLARLAPEIRLFATDVFILRTLNGGSAGGTVSALMQRRLDGEPAEDMAALCRAAVCGAGASTVMDVLEACLTLSSQFDSASNASDVAERPFVPRTGAEWKGGNERLESVREPVERLAGYLAGVVYTDVLQHVRPWEVSGTKRDVVTLISCGVDTETENSTAAEFGKDFEAAPPRKGEHWYVAIDGTVLGRRRVSLLTTVVAALRRESERPRGLEPLPHRYREGLTRGFQVGAAIAVLGPDFGVPRRASDFAQQRIGLRLHETLRSIESGKPKMFLLDLVRARAPWFDGDVTPEAMHDTEFAHRDTLICRAIIELTVLTLKATEVFGSEVKAGTSAPRSTFAWTIMPPDEQLRDLRQRAERCVKALNTIAANDKLYALGRADGGLAGRIQRLFDDHTLKADTLAWMCDAVWHLFRFDAPFYPDHRSLAFQLEICVQVTTENSPVSTWPGAAALRAGKQRESVLHLRDWMRNCLPGHSGMTHESSASVGGAYRVMANAARAGWIARNPSNLKSAAKYGGPMVVIDTNLDQALVNEVAKLDVPYAVVFPIHLGSGPAWGVRECPGDAGAPAAGGDVASVTGDAGHCWWIMPAPPVGSGRTGMEIGQLRGVVIVKAHGAPLEPLEPLRRCVDGSSKPERHHRIPEVQCVRGRLVAEEDYRDGDDDESAVVRARILFDDFWVIEDVLHPADSLPPGLRLYLLGGGDSRIRPSDGAPAGEGPANALWFMGYPLRDFARRVRIMADRRPESPINASPDFDRGHQGDSATVVPKESPTLPIRSPGGGSATVRTTATSPIQSFVVRDGEYDPISTAFLTRDRIVTYERDLGSALSLLGDDLGLEENA